MSHDIHPIGHDSHKTTPQMDVAASGHDEAYAFMEVQYRMLRENVTHSATRITGRRKNRATWVTRREKKSVAPPSILMPPLLQIHNHCPCCFSTPPLSLVPSALTQSSICMPHQRRSRHINYVLMPSLHLGIMYVALFLLYYCWHKYFC